MNELELFKTAAAKMEQFLAAEGCDIKHTRLMEGLSHAMGARNYRTLKGVLSGAGVEDASQATTDLLPLPNIGDRKFDVYVGTIILGEYGEGPSYARVEVTLAVLARIQRLAALVAENGLAYGVDWNGPDWHADDEYRMQDDTLTVYADGDFWWRAVPGHASYAVETKAIAWVELSSALEAARAAGESRVFLGADVQGLKDQVLADLGMADPI